MKEISPLVTSIAERYHEETKYTEERLRKQAEMRGVPDPARQPSPYKRFDRPGVLLRTDGLPIERSDGGEGRPGEELARAGRVLWHTNGCTRVLRFPGGLQPFRAAPSAGAMYPTEVYLAIRDTEGVEPGIYDYQILDHSLAPVRDEDPFPELSRALFGHPAVERSRLAVILTAEWFRSSWRYRERGYRRCLLDTGHVLGNLVEYAPEEGLVAIPFATFDDGRVERLLGIDPVSEGVLVVAPLVPASDAPRVPRPVLRVSPLTEWRASLQAVADRVEEAAPERIFTALHLASRIGPDAPEGERATWPSVPPREGDMIVEGDGVATAISSLHDRIATRRSTRGFAALPVARAPLLRALAHAGPAGSPAFFAPELLRSWLVTTNVTGLPAGSFAVDTDPLRLVLSREGNFEKELLHLGLGQRIFVNAAAALIHTVDLPRAVQLLGDRAYRLVKMDAGHVGERLTLALLEEGIGVSGCGGYLDDEMNRVLGIPENQAVIYITVLGTPGVGEV